MLSYQKAFVFLALVPNLLSTCQAQTLSQDRVEESIVWEQEENGMYNHHQNAMILAVNGDVLVFAEARISKVDEEPHHIAMKRSTDKGSTWGENQYIVPVKNSEAWANPIPVIDERSGKIFLFYSKVYGMGQDDQCDLYLISSTDHGHTWSEAKNLTYLFQTKEYEQQEWDYHLVGGTGSGIQLSDERLVVPIRHSRGIYDSHAQRAEVGGIIYSTDGGNIWQDGGHTPLGDYPVVEPTIIERENGNLFMNARSRFDTRWKRVESISTNKGLSWSAPVISDALPDFFNTACTMYRYSAAPNIVLFGAPAHPSERKDLTVYLSYDGGKTFPVSRQLHEGLSCNAAFVVFEDGTIGCAYGRDQRYKPNGEPDGWMPAQIGFSRFSLDWVKP